ncbi:uncharacterized protein MYCFIDRAFT_174466 [Pseudocercospora fijiensis CIRAD86]|uniref:Uncharacterized protein n=1 Tax=Pseudocercospora fijiensis (strain CIRAD86) TaxID=383855 RepID=M2YZ96_PSEFD|nr:uncharacterized protein MYCFIDRAFT_174466 [Pseudocercospora fijiensis CIRAD86]EME82965.1 hypothetical protein MYCFIDRAFT_174466 [Pseudocercospora fijiensis CIRAD86]
MRLGLRRSAQSHAPRGDGVRQAYIKHAKSLLWYGTRTRGTLGGKSRAAGMIGWTMATTTQSNNHKMTCIAFLHRHHDARRHTGSNLTKHDVVGNARGVKGEGSGCLLGILVLTSRHRWFCHAHAHACWAACLTSGRLGHLGRGSSLGVKCEAQMELGRPRSLQRGFLSEALLEQLTLPRESVRMSLAPLRTCFQLPAHRLSQHAPLDRRRVAHHPFSFKIQRRFDLTLNLEHSRKHFGKMACLPTMPRIWSADADATREERHQTYSKDQNRHKPNLFGTQSSPGFRHSLDGCWPALCCFLDSSIPCAWGTTAARSLLACVCTAPSSAVGNIRGYCWAACRVAMEDFPPDWPLTSSPVALDAHASNDSFISLYRHDSPQFTLHDFHRLQRSPVLSAPPEFDLKRLRRRRKPSTPHLAAAPLSYTDHWSPSAILPSQAHSLSQHSPAIPSFPPLPLTPRLRPSTTSPSLTSTVTTLQSTPAQTPICRAAAPQERDWADDHLEVGDHIRTKRKFEPLRRAKRLPRQRVDSGGSGQDEDELWEVHAAVFDPPLDEKLFRGLSRLTEQNHQHQHLQRQKHSSQHERAGDHQQVNEDPPSNSEAPAPESWHAPPPQQQQGQIATSSSLSLSKFDFPNPPGRDNWEGTFGKSTSLQTLHPSDRTLQGTWHSHRNLHPQPLFCIVEHLLTSSIRTRLLFLALIDGLLDDYFDQPVEKMQYDTLTGEPSQTSLRVPSENSRRVLYDDPGRRDPFSTTQCRPQRLALATSSEDECDRYDSSQCLSAHGTDVTHSLAHGNDSRKPPESGSNNQLKAIDAVLREDRNAEFAPTSPQEVKGLGITASDHGADTQATLEQSTDPTIGEILKGYDYTRVPISSEGEVDITDSRAIERARKASLEPAFDTSHGLVSPLQTPTADRKDSTRDLDAKPVLTTPPVVPVALPTPPAPVYNGTGFHYYSGCSELPTTDRTYGETNQLLLITPEAAPEYPPYSPGTPCNPKTCDNPAHIHIHPDTDPRTPVPPCVLPWYHDDKENIPPKSEDNLAELAAAAERFRFFDDDNDDDGGDVAKVLQRSSSIYSEDIEDDWETQYSDSHYDLPRNYGRISLDSYANTSFYDSRVRLSTGPSQMEGHILTPITDLSPAVSSPDDVAAQEFERRRQIKKAIKELEAKIIEDDLNVLYGSTPLDKAQRKADVEELERLRQLYPSTSDRFALKASESLISLKAKSTNKLQKVKPFRPNYNPRNSFNRIAALGKLWPAADAASDRRGLLDSPTTPTPRRGDLVWDDREATFTTLRADFSIPSHSPASFRGPATELWSPFVRDPTVKAIYGGSHSNSATTTNAKVTEVELKPLGGKTKRYKPAAMSNQYEPRQLHLLKSNRLNDAQLTARQPGWRMKPQVTANSPLGKHNEWSFAANEPMLVKPESDVEKALRADQEAISKRYLWSCAVFPPLTLAFGLGAFDKPIQKKVGGGIRGASARGKRNALLVYFPLGCIFWGILVIAMYLMVLSSKGTLYEDEKKNSAPSCNLCIRVGARSKSKH